MEDIEKPYLTYTEKKDKGGLRKEGDMIRNHQCPVCEKWFHRLGIARHIAMHTDKLRREKEAQKEEEPRGNGARRKRKK
jgi:hypothetical protein